MKYLKFFIIYGIFISFSYANECNKYFELNPNSKFNVYVENLSYKAKLEGLADLFIAKKISFELVQFRRTAFLRILDTGNHPVNKLIRKVSNLYDLPSIKVHYKGDIESLAYFEPSTKKIILSEDIMRTIDEDGWTTFVHELRHLAMDNVITKWKKKTAYRGEISRYSGDVTINNTYKEYLSFEESLTWKKDSQKIFGNILRYNKNNNIKKLKESLVYLDARSQAALSISTDIYKTHENILEGLKNKTIKPTFIYNKNSNKFYAKIKRNHKKGKVTVTYNLYVPALLDEHVSQMRKTLDFSKSKDLYEALYKQIKFEMKFVDEDSFYQTSIQKFTNIVSKQADVDKSYYIQALASTSKFSHPGRKLSPLLADYYKNYKMLDLKDIKAKSHNEEKAMDYLIRLLDREPVLANGHHFYRDPKNGINIYFDHYGRYLGLKLVK